MGHVHEVEIFIFNHQFGFSALPMGRSSNGEDGLTEESLKTMSRYRNFTTICCAAVFALGLAACGGGDDGISVADRDAAVAAEQAKTDALQMEINALRAQLGLDPEDDPAASIQDLQDEVARLQGEIDDAADKARMAQEEADRKAMATTAAKLYDGISPQMGNADLTTFAATDRNAGYNAGGSAIQVIIGDGTNIPTAVTATLSEDKKTMVVDNHGWEGKRYTLKGGYEAMVYSNVEAPKMGKKFGSAATATPTGAFQYQLDAATPAGANTAHTIDTDTAGVPARIAFTGVTRTAGTETFDLPDPNPGGADIILIPGSYHGVPGTYNCAPSNPAAGCMASVASRGFTVVGGTWTFTPDDPNARVTESADTMYASYGWWIHKAANDGPFTASAFVDERGTVAAATDLNALNGTATYQGGAAGKYALASSTGGTNDAGHFTARAMLEANFTTNTDDDETTNAITGTIDNFIGADGMPRDWSVKLNGSPIADGGGIGDASDGTVWTIGEDAAKASGNWTGSLRNNGTDGVPQVATGTFYTTYGTAGKMVGAFGANKQ